VVGGTIKLVTDQATPPGMWFAPHRPGPGDTLAVYAPLRAVVGGWSGTTNDGWSRMQQSWADDGTSRDLVTFEVERFWFTKPGYAEDARLRVRIRANSLADEGRTRRGFRYRNGHDSPMQVVEATWLDANGTPRPDWPVPPIQLMAPPRVPRISDFDEKVQQMNPREADLWAKQGVVHTLLHMPNPAQQRTPVGRGLPLFEAIVSQRLAAMPLVGSTLTRLAGQKPQFYRVQLHNPLRCDSPGWKPLLTQMMREAQELGLDMESDAVIEWWLERQGYDSAVLERGAHPYDAGRVVVAFRRAQIVEVVN
jgi:hypothetical protein